MARSRENRRQDEDVVDLQLERGQVTTLGVGAILALGATFLLGVGFGRQVAPAEETPAAAPVAEANDQSPPAPTLTFHDALTSKQVAPAQPAPAPKPAPVTPKPKAAEPEPEPAEAPAAPKVAEAAPAAPAPAPAPARPAPAKASAGEGSWTVQVVSSQKRDETEKLVKRLADAGYAARMVEAEIPGRGTWYRVRVGRFEDKTSAALEQAEIKVALGMAGLVVSE